MSDPDVLSDVTLAGISSNRRSQFLDHRFAQQNAALDSCGVVGAEDDSSGTLLFCSRKAPSCIRFQVVLISYPGHSIW